MVSGEREVVERVVDDLVVRHRLHPGRGLSSVGLVADCGADSLEGPTLSLPRPRGRPLTSARGPSESAPMNVAAGPGCASFMRGARLPVKRGGQARARALIASTRSPLRAGAASRPRGRRGAPGVHPRAQGSTRAAGGGRRGGPPSEPVGSKARSAPSGSSRWSGPGKRVEHAHFERRRGFPQLACQLERLVRHRREPGSTSPASDS